MSTRKKWMHFLRDELLLKVGSNMFTNLAKKSQDPNQQNLGMWINIAAFDLQTLKIMEQMEHHRADYQKLDGFQAQKVSILRHMHRLTILACLEMGYVQNMAMLTGKMTSHHW